MQKAKRNGIVLYLAILFLSVFALTVPELSSATVYYAYGCEDNTIASASFTGSGLSCTNQTVINGSYSIRFSGSNNGYINISTLPGIPANFNATFWIIGSSATVSAGNPTGTCFTGSTVADGCYATGQGIGMGFDDSVDPAYYGLAIGSNYGNNIVTDTMFIRYEKAGANVIVYFNNTLKDSYAKSASFFQFFSGNGAGYNFTIDDLCIWTTNDTSCYATPSPPSTVVVITASLNNSINSTISGYWVTLSGNGTQTNCTSGNGGSQFFNYSLTQTISSTTTVYGQATQAYIDVNTTQLFTGSTIYTFNATSWVYKNTTTNGVVRVPALNGSNNIMVQAPGNYSKNTTCTVSSPLSTTTCSVSGVYDNLFTIGAKNASTNSGISWFNVTVTNASISLSNNTETTTGVIIYQLLRGYDYNFFISANGLGITNVTLPANASTNLYNFSLLIENSINITFIDETTDVVINTTTILLELIGNSSTYTYNTSTGRVNASLLVPQEYLLRYGATGYLTRFGTFTLNPKSNNVFNLYLCSTSTCGNVTITVQDTLNNRLEGAIVKILKYDVATNTYIQRDFISTNFDGQGISRIELNNEYYKFIVEYDDAVVLTTSPSYIFSTSITLTVSLSASGFENTIGQGAVTGSVSNVSSNGNSTILTFLWNDRDNTASTGTITAYQLTRSGRTSINSTTGSGSSGQVFVTIPNTQDTTFQIEGTVNKDGTNMKIDEESVAFASIIPENDGYGLFIMILVIIVMALIGVWNPTIAIVLVGVTPLLFILTGIVNLGMATGVAVFAFSIVIAY